MPYITYFVTTYLFKESSVYAPRTHTITSVTTTRTVYRTSLNFYPHRVMLSRVVKSEFRQRRSMRVNRMYIILIGIAATTLPWYREYIRVYIYI